jgi:hypothetical protein
LKVKSPREAGHHEKDQRGARDLERQLGAFLQEQAAHRDEKGRDEEELPVQGLGALFNTLKPCAAAGSCSGCA